MEGIVVGLIGLVGAVLGALIQAFAPHFVEKFIYSDKSRMMKGRWRCHWEVTSQIEGMNEGPIDDVVDITRIAGNKMFGKGIGAVHGSYTIEGRISPFALVFHIETIRRAGRRF